MDLEYPINDIPDIIFDAPETAYYPYIPELYDVYDIEAPAK